MANFIEHYEFGKIKIAGHTYTSDIKILGEKIIQNWWREEGHNLCIDDIRDILEYKPDVLIIGNGYAGVMQVPTAVRGEIEKSGINCFIQKTKEAVDLYNQEASLRKAGAFHLTC